MRRASILVLVVSVLLSVTSIGSAQSKTRERLIEEIKEKRSELSVLEKQILDVADSDRTANALLLNQPNTGIIRLLPREGFDTDAMSKVDESRRNQPEAMVRLVPSESSANSSKKDKVPLTVNGDGAYYSFERLTHEYGYGSDISLEQGFLKVGFAGADYGMIFKLGDVPVHDLSTEHPLVLALTKYNPAKTEPDARVEQRRFSTGTEFEGMSLKDRVPVEVGATYLLRSISYRRSDVLVAFKVTRKDSDGSLIIVWKLMEKYPVPQLARTVQNTELK